MGIEKLGLSLKKLTPGLSLAKRKSIISKDTALKGITWETTKNI